MRVIIKEHKKESLIIMIPENINEEKKINEFKKDEAGEHYLLKKVGSAKLQFFKLENDILLQYKPINIIYTSNDKQIKLISNFAFTPFLLNGIEYASVEAFWQGLKFPQVEERERIAKLYGSRAKFAGSGAPDRKTFKYIGQRIRFGSSEHWALMKKACIEKFTQNLNAKEALLNTGNRPLSHKVKRDSLIIPGIIMAEIWTKIRAGLIKN